MAYCPESMVEWSTRWEEVKKTMVRGLDFTEEIMHRRVYKGLYLSQWECFWLSGCRHEFIISWNSVLPAICIISAWLGHVTVTTTTTIITSRASHMPKCGSLHKSPSYCAVLSPSPGRIESRLQVLTQQCTLHSQVNLGLPLGHFQSFSRPCRAWASSLSIWEFSPVIVRMETSGSDELVALWQMSDFSIDDVVAIEYTQCTMQKRLVESIDFILK